MEDILEILKYILPSVITFLASYLIIKRFLDNDYRKKTVDIRMQNQKTMQPIRLQAYERLVLLLERISLPSLVQRTHKQGMSARLLQSELLKAIRAEFDHNLSQQVYITNKSWDSLKTAKEETVKVINIAASRLNEDASGMDLINVIFEIVTKVDRLPTDIAIDILKMEARQIF
ncbi:MAG: hypothetical protein RLZZ46_655 [Bacteroidota bacterium]|jgi:hypothetical protein